MQHERDMSRPGRRRLLGALLAAVFGVLSVSVVLAPPAAAALGTVQSGASWSAVQSSVGPGTPLWTLDVTFSLSGVSCTNGAELHYKIHTSAQKALLCGSGGTAPTTYTVRRPVFAAPGSNISTLTPASTAEVRAEVRDVGEGLNNNPSGAVRTINVPPAPKWIGMGDGYTSAVYQPYDRADPLYGSDQYVANKASHSWIQAATTKLNGNYAVPNTWAVTPVIMANSTATAVADGASSVDLQDQITQMETTLAAASYGTGSSKIGSWNWVGMSAGFVDVGIPAAMTAFYSTYDADAGSTVKPWDAASTAQCPDLSTVSSNVTAKGASIKTALETVVTRAKAQDSSVRVINVLYPYLTDNTNEQVQGDSGPYTNPCAAANRPVINALDSAITLSGTNVFNLDLRSAAGFGDRPTGTRVYQQADQNIRGSVSGVTRVGSFLWLTREHGYPYPSLQGASQAGNAAVDVTTSQVTDVEPPVVTGVPVRAADRNGWYNHPVDILWTGADRPNPGGTGINGPTQRTTTAGTAGLQQRWTSPEFCDNNPTPLCATGNLDLSTDFTPPAVSVSTSPAAPNAAGWFRTPVGITFTATDAMSGVAGSKVHTQSVVVDVPITTVTREFCDNAGLCGSRSTTLKVDTTPPVVTPSVPSGRSAHGWYKNDVTIGWSVTDTLSGPVTTSLAPTTVTSEGVSTARSEKASDVAGNQAEGSVSVKIDKTRPAVTITGPQPNGEYGEGKAPLPEIGCTASDPGGSSASGLDGECTVLPLASSDRVALKDGAGTTIGYTFTRRAEATDKAGNSRASSVTFKVFGFVDVAKPEVRYEVLDDPAGNDSWHWTPPRIRWEFEDDSPLTFPEAIRAQVQTVTQGNQAAGVRWKYHYTELATNQGPNVAYPSPGPVVDEVDNSLAAGAATATISLDTVDPSVEVRGPIAGKTYTSPLPADAEPTAVCGDYSPGSGVIAASCELQTTKQVDLQINNPSGPPGYYYEYTATATDVSGRTNIAEPIGFVLYSFEPVSAPGRFTGSADLPNGTKASFTFRCNGSPNNLTLNYGSDQFDLTHTDRLWCWDEGTEGGPDAPMSHGVLWGRGVRKSDGAALHIRITLGDHGEPGKGADTMEVVLSTKKVVDLPGGTSELTDAVWQESGVNSGNGNIQAQDATGDGTNDSGDTNNPGKK